MRRYGRSNRHNSAIKVASIRRSRRPIRLLGFKEWLQKDVECGDGRQTKADQRIERKKCFADPA